MDETMNVQTAPVIPENIPEEIPENTLLNEPEYILKKKFCLATIPGIIATLATAFMAAAMIFTGIMYIIEGFGAGPWSYLVSGAEFTMQFAAMTLLCILMFIKVNKPFICAPLFVTALSYAVVLVSSMVQTYNPKEFEAHFHYEDFFGEIANEYYSYSDYMIIRASSWIFLALMLFGFIAAAVYVILASSKKLNGKVGKLWLVPAVVFVPSVVMYLVNRIIDFALYYVGLDMDILGKVMLVIPIALVELAIYVPQIITVILLCKWISNPYKKVLKKTPKAPVPAPAPVMYVPVPQPVQMPVPENQADDRQNNIELIKQYKDLLDMGAITQEEYDEKKKELL